MVFGYNVNLDPAERSRTVQPGLLIALCIALASAPLLAACSRSDAAAAEDATLAQSLFEQRRFAEARMAIKDAIAERDDEPQYHILRARIEFAVNAIPQAYDAYNNARSLDPSNLEALQAVSQLGLQTGHLRESLDATDTILSLSPDEPSALLTRGLHSIIRGRFDEANDYADKILSRDPANEGGAILKSRAIFRKGDSQAALAALDQFSAAHDDTVGVAMTRLELYRALNDASGMRVQFAKLRTLAPDNSGGRVDEANFAFKDGRPADGLSITADLLANPKLSRDQIPVILGLWREYAPAGVSAADLGRISAQGAVAARTATAAYLVEHGRTDAAAGVVANLRGADRVALDAGIAVKRSEWAKALSLANSVLEEDETHCLALTVRSEVRLHTGNLQGALRSAQEAVSQCRSQTWAWRSAAISYSRRGDIENAQRIWRQGIEANRQNSEFASEAVRWFEANGQDREAVAIARRLTHDAPALLSGWRLYAEVCARAGQPCVADARRGLSRAATIYAIDLLPGQSPPNGLFGRIVTR